MSCYPLYEKYMVQAGKLYTEDPDKVLCGLKYVSVAGSLATCYNVLVGQGELPAIRELPDKERLWKQSREHSPNRRHRIMIVKAIYLLEQITKCENT